ncbi:MAG: hypothetical protein AAF823_04000 [Planctomycetota bacterium]
MNRFAKLILAGIASLGLSVALVGCEEEGPGDSMEDAVEDVGDAMDDAGDNLREGVEEIGDDIEDATD